MRLFVSVPLLLILIAFLVISDSLYYRSLLVRVYRCQVVQLVHLPKDVDFLAFGSSRARVGINPVTLQKESKELRNAYNLSLGGSNSVRSYSWVRDIFNAGYRPKVVFVEIDLRDLSYEQRDSLYAIDEWEGMASYLDYFDMINLYKAPLLKEYFVISSRVFKKLDSDINLLTTGNVQRALNALGSNTRPAKVCLPGSFRRPPTKSKIQSIAESKEEFDNYAAISGSPYREDIAILDTLASQRELYYLQKIRELTVQYDAMLIVSRSWQAYERPLSPDDIREIQEVVPEFIFPPTDLVESTWPLFQDSNHFTIEGGELYTRWLAKEIDSAFLLQEAQ